MYSHCALTIPIVPPDELCHVLDVHRNKHNRQLLCILPSAIRRTISTPEQPAGDYPAMMLIFVQEVSDEDGQRIMERRPPQDQGPAEAPAQPVNRLIEVLGSYGS